MTAEIEARYLPASLQAIVELIGLPATLKLVSAYGGVRLYIPKRYDPDHPLVKLLGHAHAATLCETYGGDEHFDIPRALAAIRAARNARMRNDRSMGATHRELALRYGLIERQVRNILGDDEEDDRQSGFFD